MLHRIRFAMLGEQSEKLVDRVEVDEIYIGGKVRNMHKHVREARIHGSGALGKAIAMGMLERGGKVVTKRIEFADRPTLRSIVRPHVDNAAIYTAVNSAYLGLSNKYRHGVVDHAVSYMEGQVHTKGLENIWSLLKRTISGTYVSVEPFHLHRYLDEQAFLYNNRKDRRSAVYLHAVDRLGFGLIERVKGDRKARDRWQ